MIKATWSKGRLLQGTA